LTVENYSEDGNTRVEKSRIRGIKKKNRIRNIVLLTIGVVLVLLFVVFYQIKYNVDKITIPKTDIEDIIDLKQDEDELVFGQDDKDFYFLVLGLDYRDDHNALLTDSIMVLHIVPQQTKVKLLSIPRDLLVENSRGASVKINSLFSEGITLATKKAKEDPSLLIGDTVELGNKQLDKGILSGAIANTRTKLEDLLDIQISNSVIVNFSAVIDLVNEVGGVEIDVKRSMKYRPTNLYLEPGLQILNGDDALGYARFREDDRGTKYFASDFERGQRQQEVLKALAKEILSWKNSAKSLKLLSIVADNVQTDMDASTMYSMITGYYDVFSNESFISLPFPEQYSSSGDVIITEDKLLELQSNFKALE